MARPGSTGDRRRVPPETEPLTGPDPGWLSHGGNERGRIYVASPVTALYSVRAATSGRSRADAVDRFDTRPDCTSFYHAPGHLPIWHCGGLFRSLCIDDQCCVDPDWAFLLRCAASVWQIRISSRCLLRRKPYGYEEHK
ncbi:hypothetical protein MRX96_024735 [Rhipicephalus microplus]